jgi:hypothetical protein
MGRGSLPWMSKTLVTKVRVRLWADDGQTGSYEPGAAHLTHTWPKSDNTACEVKSGLQLSRIGSTCLRHSGVLGPSGLEMTRRYTNLVTEDFAYNHLALLKSINLLPSWVAVYFYFIHKCALFPAEPTAKGGSMLLWVQIVGLLLLVLIVVQLYGIEGNIHYFRIHRPA